MHNSTKTASKIISFLLPVIFTSFPSFSLIAVPSPLSVYPTIIPCFLLSSLSMLKQFSHSSFSTPLYLHRLLFSFIIISHPFNLLIVLLFSKSERNWVLLVCRCFIRVSVNKKEKNVQAKYFISLMLPTLTRNLCRPGYA